VERARPATESIALWSVNLRRHADGFPKRWMRVNRLANIHRIRTHLNRQRNLTNHVACMRADHVAAQDLAVAPASMAVRPLFG